MLQPRSKKSMMAKGVSVCVRTGDATVHGALARPAAVFDN
jgi:hypothetical protein